MKEIEQAELPFEPAPGSTADLDYDKWKKYLDQCDAEKVHPSIKDFLVWLEEQE